MRASVATIIGVLLAGISNGPLACLVTPRRQDIRVPCRSGQHLRRTGGRPFARPVGVGDTAGIDWLKLFLQVGVAARAVGGLIALRSN